MLTKDQKKSRLDISKYLLSLYEDDPEEFMCRFVTQFETWAWLTFPKKFKGGVFLVGKVMASLTRHPHPRPHPSRILQIQSLCTTDSFQI